MSYAPNSENVQSIQAKIADASLSARDKSDLAFDLMKLAAREKIANHAEISRSLGELSGRLDRILDSVTGIEVAVKDVGDKPKLE